MAKNHVQDKIDQIKTKLTNGKLENGAILAKKYLKVLSEDYLVDYSITEIVNDIKMMESLSEESQYSVRLGLNTKEDNPNLWQVKLFKINDKVSLSRGLPIIENFGVKLLDEHPYKIRLSDELTIHICDFGIQVPEEVVSRLHDAKQAKIFCDAIVDVFNRKVENGVLNKLVLFSGLDMHQVTLLRALTNYLIQTALPFSHLYTAACLCSYPTIACNLYLLFDAKFNIKHHNQAKFDAIREEILTELNQVVVLDDDRILKAYLTVIEAMLRTNYYQKNSDGNYKEYISFKLESQKIPFLPKPFPLYEVFVYSMRFEAIHLRGGKVARGGFRWSDRREDFRTEVLGLVKAQRVKNSVIVPTGSKGGFVCKKLPPITERDKYMAEGIACYKSFISGLLDITDNLVMGKIVPPIDVVRYDSDDPYLVVAADKGTATFSDYANEMSAKYGFWLGDAFASGGSVGYDHKKMGITAKGAWEACKRHFRHLGKNIQTEDFTVIGLGDMSGDVFGNGMLLSRHIKLIAAFNHQHIFLDPNPNPELSFIERERLFNLPTSTWANYDLSKISAGGGIFLRSAKSIPLSKEVQTWLKVKVDSMSPNDLIHTLLKAEADLFYNGGIGTYIKAESESHEDVKDKANDSIRVNGKDLQVKVVVEGGNLGATQLGRIEFAKHGGLICTDAIDNSAGVDCSDHEVNIKILFADIMQKAKMTLDKRNTILESMTNDVSDLVLRDNYLQTQILSYATARAHELFPIHINFIEKLEKSGELDRAVEFLPDHQEILERQRAGIGLTAPELAVLVAYAKITLDHMILNSELVESNEFDELLINYFPEYLRNNYSKYITNHYLRKEIISNQLANLIINHMGFTFVSRFSDEFRVGIASIIRAVWAVFKLFNVEQIYSQIEALDNQVAADVQIELFIRIKKALERTTRWILRHTKSSQEITSLMSRYHDEAMYLLAELPNILQAENYPNMAVLETKYIADGVPAGLAATMARAGAIPQLLDILMLSHEAERKFDVVARNYFFAGRTLRMDWLRKNLIALPEHNKWQSLSRSALLADGYTLYSTLIRSAISTTDSNDDNFCQTWIVKETEKIKQINDMMDELQSYKTLDLAMLSAVVRELGYIIAK